jgi:hypothetical protein
VRSFANNGNRVDFRSTNGHTGSSASVRFAFSHQSASATLFEFVEPCISIMRFLHSQISRLGRWFPSSIKRNSDNHCDTCVAWVKTRSAARWLHSMQIRCADLSLDARWWMAFYWKFNPLNIEYQQWHGAWSNRHKFTKCLMCFVQGVKIVFPLEVENIAPFFNWFHYTCDSYAQRKGNWNYTSDRLCARHNIKVWVKNV